MDKKVIKVDATIDTISHFTTKQWDAAYLILTGDQTAKYISIDFDRGIDVVVSKFKLKFAGGTRYFVSVPYSGIALSMMCSISEIGMTATALRNANLDSERAITIAHVLHDLGDF